MDEQYDKMSDFFRKKLVEEQSPQMDWDRPDPELRKQLLRQLHTRPEKSNNQLYLLPLLLLLGFAGAIGYIAWLHVQLHNLRDQPITLQAAKVSESPSDKVGDEYTAVEAGFQRRLRELEAENTRLSTQNSFLQNELRRQEKALQANRDAARMPPFTLPTNSGRGIVSSGKLLPAALPLLSPISRLSNIRSTVDVPENLPVSGVDIPVPEAIYSRFELGYSLSFTAFDLSVSHTFPGQRLATPGLRESRITLPAQALSVSYAPVQNWWIESGLRYSSVALHNRYQLGIAYKTGNESQRPDGSRINEFRMLTSTAFSKTESRFELVIPTEDELAEGDLLEVDLSEHRQLRYLQIPLGLRYGMTRGRWEWSLAGGAQWNRIRTTKYGFSVLTSVAGRGVSVTNRRVSTTDETGRSFWSAYAGFGLGYHITGRWQLRAALSQNFYFLPTRQTGFPHSPGAGTTWQMGLYYRFSH